MEEEESTFIGADSEERGRRKRNHSARRREGRRIVIREVSFGVAASWASRCTCILVNSANERGHKKKQVDRTSADFQLDLFAHFAAAGPRGITAESIGEYFAKFRASL